jgi:predicted dehydrogenase
MNLEHLTRTAVRFTPPGWLATFFAMLLRLLFRPRIESVVIIGGGDVTHGKLMPAIARLTRPVRVAVCDIASASPLSGDDGPHEYFQINPSGLLPFAELRAAGFKPGKTLFYIASPSETHHGYAAQLAGVAALVLIEKPLTMNCLVADDLAALTEGLRVFPVDHYLAKQGVAETMTRLRRSPAALARVARIVIEVFEPGGFAVSRRPAEAIPDMQWHAFSLLTHLLGGAGEAFAIEVNSAATGKHRPDRKLDFIARATTASRVGGRARFDSGRIIEFDLRQAKAAGKSTKWVRGYDAAGHRVFEADLGESGWQPHFRVLEMALEQGGAGLQTMTEAAAIAELVDVARARASDAGSYTFGAVPEFLGQEEREPAVERPVRKPEPAGAWHPIWAHLRAAMSQHPVAIGSGAAAAAMVAVLVL